MSKKVLMLSSSPRQGGNSDVLCDEFMKGALEVGNEVEKIFLKDKQINYCTGCSVCSMYGKPCPQKDDAAEVVEKMIAADVIMMERTIDGFRGFLDCLEGPVEKGVIYGVGAWKVGEIKDKSAMQEAYRMGKDV